VDELGQVARTVHQLPGVAHETRLVGIAGQVELNPLEHHDGDRTPGNYVDVIRSP